MAISVDVLTDTFIKLGIENTKLSRRISENFDNKTNTLIYYGKLWSYEEEEVLRLLVNKGVPWSVISRLHERSESALKARLKQFQNRPPPEYKSSVPIIVTDNNKKDIPSFNFTLPTKNNNISTFGVTPKVNNIPDFGAPTSFDFSFKPNSLSGLKKTMKPNVNDKKGDTSFSFTFPTKKDNSSSPIDNTTTIKKSNYISGFDPKNYQFNFTLNNVKIENQDKTLNEEEEKQKEKENGEEEEEDDDDDDDDEGGGKKEMRKEKETSKTNKDDVDDVEKVRLYIEKTKMLDEKIGKEKEQQQNDKNKQKVPDQTQEQLIRQISKISINHPTPPPSSSTASIKMHTSWSAEDDLLLVQYRAIKLSYKNISKLLSVERTPAAISNHYASLKLKGIGFLEDYYSANKQK